MMIMIMVILWIVILMKLVKFLLALEAWITLVSESKYILVVQEKQLETSYRL